MKDSKRNFALTEDQVELISGILQGELDYAEGEEETSPHLAEIRSILRFFSAMYEE